MQGINCVKGEIHNVLTVLRLNQPPQYRRNAYSAEGISLHAVHKFLVYGYINSDSPCVAQALANITHAVTHCHFDVRDKEDAEVVQMKVLEILLECLRCPAGHLLTNEAVCNMVTECFSVRSKQGVTKLLRRYAENVLMQMVLVMFARLSPDTNTGGKEITVPPFSNGSYSHSEGAGVAATSASSTSSPALSHSNSSSALQSPHPLSESNSSSVNSSLLLPHSVSTPDSLKLGRYYVKEVCPSATISYIRAYLDTLKMPDQAKLLHQSQVRLTSIDGNKTKSADNTMIDDLTTGMEKERIICVVSGDRDFSRFLVKLVRQGKEVILVYNKQTWKTMKENAHWLASKDYVMLDGMQELRQEQSRKKQEKKKKDAANQSGPNRKTKMCKFFNQGKCEYQDDADSCKFDHRCSACGEPHPVFECTTATPSLKSHTEFASLIHTSVQADGALPIAAAASASNVGTPHKVDKSEFVPVQYKSDTDPSSDPPSYDLASSSKASPFQIPTDFKTLSSVSSSAVVGAVSLGPTMTVPLHTKSPPMPSQSLSTDTPLQDRLTKHTTPLFDVKPNPKSLSSLYPHGLSSEDPHDMLLNVGYIHSRTITVKLNDKRNKKENVKCRMAFNISDARVAIEAHVLQPDVMASLLPQKKYTQAKYWLPEVTNASVTNPSHAPLVCVVTTLGQNPQLLFNSPVPLGPLPSSLPSSSSSSSTPSSVSSSSDMSDVSVSQSSSSSVSKSSYQDWMSQSSRSSDGMRVVSNSSSVSSDSGSVKITSWPSDSGSAPGSGSGSGSGSGPESRSISGTLAPPPLSMYSLKAFWMSVNVTYQLCFYSYSPSIHFSHFIRIVPFQKHLEQDVKDNVIDGKLCQHPLVIPPPSHGKHLAPAAAAAGVASAPASMVSHAAATGAGAPGAPAVYPYSSPYATAAGGGPGMGMGMPGGVGSMVGGGPGMGMGNIGMGMGMLGGSGSGGGGPLPSTYPYHYNYSMPLQTQSAPLPQTFVPSSLSGVGVGSVPVSSLPLAGMYSSKVTCHRCGGLHPTDKCLKHTRTCDFFNKDKCRFINGFECNFLHNCSICFGEHPATRCPHRPMSH